MLGAMKTRNDIDRHSGKKEHCGDHIFRLFSKEFQKIFQVQQFM